MFCIIYNIWLMYKYHHLLEKFVYFFTRVSHRIKLKMEETIELKINDSNQQSSSLITFTEILLMTISCACLVIFIQISLKKRKLDQLTKHIRGPKSYPIIGSAYLFRGTNEGK